MEATKQQTQTHFVLVHGACHGAWCWYKLKPLLESHGHKVTALDLSASGINMKKIEELRTLYDYTEPLMEVMESLPPGEKVVLVGHSLGGLNLALAMDKFPQKISTAVFLTAFMPDTVHKPSFVIEQSLKGTTPESWLDTKFESYGTPEMPLTSMLFGPKFLASKLYQLCPIQDFTLATMLVRPGSLFLEDLAHANNFSNEGYGSVARVFVVCNEDYTIPEEFQRWMIENSGGVKEVKEIKGADHMAMFSKPRELCCCLLEIANKLT
ncbi:Salicylic acid-binding protein 2 [Camellia lanceoleosa]|uniref:Salicylic acid-binding protein 2 n=1 Tax=Camellia lanceoleosa TaxID=1840588 RepID=A0ACC0J170_9ERIC|nr:Salicylic acid-binding protein 2 [Camellia lanceoleosa]